MRTRIRRRACPDPLPHLPAVLHPVLARVYAARGIAEAAELERSAQGLDDYSRLQGIESAVQRLAAAVERGERILVVGDFDADGATSSALAVRALRSLGARDVDFLVPNRFEFGYGLTPEIVAVAAERAPSLIITVDNGISSVEGVAAATGQGIDVVVTDHHLPGRQLPAAVAIVNPNQPGDAFPSKHLAGVGVIFYVMSALRAALRERGWFEQAGIAPPKLGDLLDLVALGTVADVVPLDRTNRILVAQGLARIRAGRCCAGITALLRCAGRDPAGIVAADLGFAAGPRLNAAGRLTDMRLGIECLLCDEDDAAREYAARLDALNRERRSIEADMQAQALASLERLQLADAPRLPFGVCLYQPDWHQGVIGILASRIKERLHRPVIAFADAGDDLIKGSARSVAGLHIRDALDAVAARHPELLHKFGGHAMAAGLSLARADLDAFAAAFDEEVRRHLGEEDLAGVLLSDGELRPEDLSLPLAEALREGGPWGQGFPEPLFDGEFALVQQRIVGERHLKLTLRLGTGGATLFDAIAFGQADHHPLPPEARLRLAYRLDVNAFNGRRSLQLRIEHLQVVANGGKGETEPVDTKTVNGFLAGSEKA